MFPVQPRRGGPEAPDGKTVYTHALYLSQLVKGVCGTFPEILCAHTFFKNDAFVYINRDMRMNSLSVAAIKLPQT